MPYALELFKGTGSVGDVFQRNGFNVVALDCERKFAATITVDILRWDFAKAFPPRYFDYIWASPPCTEYSQALQTRPRNIRKANQIVRRTLQIIQYFKPFFWFIENPGVFVAS